MSACRVSPVAPFPGSRWVCLSGWAAHAVSILISNVATKLFGRESLEMTKFALVNMDIPNVGREYLVAPSPPRSSKLRRIFCSRMPFNTYFGRESLVKPKFGRESLDKPKFGRESPYRSRGSRRVRKSRVERKIYISVQIQQYIHIP